MKPTSADATTPDAAAAAHADSARAGVPMWQRFPAVAIGFTLLLLGVLATPLVRSSERLTWTIAGVGSVLLAWEAILWVAKRGMPFAVRFAPVRAHYVQGVVQFCIYVYWGSHSSGVGPEFQLIFAQIVFVYALTALLAWSRGRTFELGFGVFPIIFSTNLLMWFKHDYYYFQFAMISVGALGKEFVRWKRDGRSTHIFNPSVFGQSIAGLILIATGTTTKYTVGDLIAVSFESLPNIFILLFVLGIVVQSLFTVTLVTLSAVTTLIALNTIYTASTGAYWFVTINIGATVFLGMHLLLTDPATSPRTFVGRVLFGAGYAIGYFLLFKLFNRMGVPEFWDKLLPVPVLNLIVPWLERITRRGLLGSINAAWERSLTRPRLNLLHMAVWTCVFATMLGTGYVQGDHERRQIKFWRAEYEAGKPHAGENLLLITQYEMSLENPEAFNMYGKLLIEGKLVEKNDEAAAHFFAKACAAKFPLGCENTAAMFMYTGRADSPEAVQLAFDHLEEYAKAEISAPALVTLGLAYERGFGRPQDSKRALEYFDRACAMEDLDGCRGFARVTLAARGMKGPIVEQAVEKLANDLLQDARKKKQN